MNQGKTETSVRKQPEMSTVPDTKKTMCLPMVRVSQVFANQVEAYCAARGLKKTKMIRKAVERMIGKTTHPD